ncbi:hypothetical protein CUMW_236590 [Citrus unshiu]|nr:hypothetical protein CUMW_236590 [Citrus unshiu]
MLSPTLSTVVPSPVLLILFFVSSFLITVSSEPNEEADALLKWKASLQNHNRSLLSSWIKDTTNVSSKISPCAWSGISCNDAGRVVSINLRDIGLKGTLHGFSFSSFPHLAYLDLTGSGIFGTIPPQISNLTNLSSLYLGSNQLSGNIPPEIGLLSHLKFLFMDTNQLDGPIPPEVALEVIKGKHPRDFLSSISSSSLNTDIELDEMLDPRLPTPTRSVQEKLRSIVKVAFSCLNESPESRPTMKIVSRQLRI